MRGNGVNTVVSLVASSDMQHDLIGSSHGLDLCADWPWSLMVFTHLRCCMFDRFNPRTAGVDMCPSHRFFAASVITVAQIWHSYSFVFCVSCVKILTPGGRSYQVRLPSHVKWRHLKTQFSKFDILPQPQFWTQCFQTFRTWWGQ